jgi:hypothetical protein
MFVKFHFSKHQVDSYVQTAERDLSLASSKEAEIKFQFSYNCLLKLAQAVCAYNNLKVKARSGHHVALLDKYAELLDSRKIIVVAKAMRDKRNRDLYDGGAIITTKEAEVYYKFVKALLIKTKLYLSID